MLHESRRQLYAHQTLQPLLCAHSDVLARSQAYVFHIFRAHYHTVLALSKRNPNAAEIILFLHRLSSVRGSLQKVTRSRYSFNACQVLVEYFKELEEESIRDNFVIIYELLDEMMDFGYPQTTESKILQE